MLRSMCTLALMFLVSYMGSSAQSRSVTVRLPQPVLASGHLLPAGTYDLRITNERPAAPSGALNELQRVVEFWANGSVAGRDVAEVFPAPGPAVPTAAVQLLKEGEYVRVAINASDARYLVHLPVSRQ